MSESLADRHGMEHDDVERGSFNLAEPLNNKKHEDFPFDESPSTPTTTTSPSTSSILLRLYQKIPSRYNRYMFLTLLGAVLCYAVLFVPGVHRNVDGDIKIRKAFSYEKSYGTAMLISITLLVPLILDELMDFVHYFTIRSHDREKKTWKTIYNGPERFIFMLGMSLDDLIYRLPPSTYNTLLIWQCTIRAQSVLVAGVLFAAEARLDEDFTHPVVGCIMYLSFILGNAITPFAADDTNNTLIFIINDCFSYVSAIIFLVSMMRSAWKCFHQLYTYASWGKATPDPPSTYEEGFLMYHFIKIASTILWTLLKVWSDLTTPKIVNCQDKDLFSICIPDIVFQFFLLVFTMRLVKYEAIETHHALDVEKQYVRCITHELSTKTSHIDNPLPIGQGVVDVDAASEDEEFKVKQSKRSVSFHESSINGGAWRERGWEGVIWCGEVSGDDNGNVASDRTEMGRHNIRRSSRSRSRLRRVSRSIRTQRTGTSTGIGGGLSGHMGSGMHYVGPASAVSSLGSTSTYDQDLQDDLDEQIKLQLMLGRILVKSEQRHVPQYGDSDSGGSCSSDCGGRGGEASGGDRKVFPNESSAFTVIKH